MLEPQPPPLKRVGGGGGAEVTAPTGKKPDQDIKVSPRPQNFKDPNKKTAGFSDVVDHVEVSSRMVFDLLWWVLFMISFWV